jgi:hypothetical protein
MEPGTMKNLLRLALFAMSLTLGACATSRNELVVTVECDPVGAALYSGDKFLGYCEHNQFYYDLDEQSVKSGGFIIEPLTARWVSGANSRLDTQVNLASGYNQYVRFTRPPDFPNASADLDFAIQYRIAKLGSGTGLPTYDYSGAGIYPYQGTVRPDTYVHGYTRSDGTYVQGYRRTLPDASRSNNYSSWGNINPYTGRRGSRQ